MKLCIAEKPSVAREIAKILGARQNNDGYMEGNGYCVTWTYGHLCTLKEPDDYQGDWKKWSLYNLPILPERFETKLIKRKGISKQFGTIKRLCKKADVVINCGDAGQEGELIQRWVLKQAGYNGKILRLWISSLTPEAIKDGFKNLKNGSDYDNLYYAGSSRAIGDWLLGINATRLYTLKYGGYKQVLSVGRVQTPTLAMIAERQKEIENFKPEPYWELHTIYREVDFQYVKGRFTKEEVGQKLLEQVTEYPFEILSSDRVKGKELPPKLFDLTSLQVNCNKRFGYSADQTLKIVQQLYEKKLVTYPRVDTTYLPNDMYSKIHGILSKLTNFSQFTQSLLGKTIRKSAKVFNDKKVTDHHAIIPTGVQKNIAGNELNVYNAITKRFIAAFYPDCIFAKTTVIGESNGVQFKTTGKEILEEGWRVLYPKPKSKSSKFDNKKGGKKEEDVILPAFKVGEKGEHKPSLPQKMTQPPKYFSEATLLRGMETAGKQIDDEELRELMKSNGIGRPSTRANIIETLFRRKYIQRKRKQIHATPMGVQLIDTIQNDLLKSAELTGQWEKQLREIEEGTFGAKNFIDNMKAMISKLTMEVKQDTKRPTIATPQKGTTNAPFAKKITPRKPLGKKITDSTCPKCQQGKMLKGKTAYGCGRWKEGCDFRLPYQFAEKEIPPKQLQRLLENGSTILLSGFKQNNQTLKGKLFFDENFALQLKTKDSPPARTNTIKKPISKRKNSSPTRTNTIKPTISKRQKSQKKSDILICPKCQKGEVLKGKTAYGCSQWQSGCDYRYPFDEVRKKIGNQTISKELVRSILLGKV